MTARAMAVGDDGWRDLPLAGIQRLLASSFAQISSYEEGARFAPQLRRSRRSRGAVVTRAAWSKIARRAFVAGDVELFRYAAAMAREVE